MRAVRLNNVDLVASVAVALIMVPAVALSSGLVRVTLGLPFLLVLPGYVLLVALFPRRADMPGLERLVLSLGLSLAALPLVGITLSFSPWGIRLLPITLALALVIVVSAGFAFYRRHRLSIENDWVIQLLLLNPVILQKWLGQSRVDQVLRASFILAVLGLMATFVFVMATPKINETFTEFYLLGDKGRMDGYPGPLIPGEAAKVTLGLINQEHATMVYRIEVRIGDEQVAVVDPIKLQPEQRWQHAVEFQPPKPGKQQRAEFLLYKDQSNEPYRSLHLLLDVG